MSYPMLIGRISLRNDASPRPLSPQWYLLHATRCGRTQLFWRGERRDLFQSSGRNGCRLLLGSVYAIGGSHNGSANVSTALHDGVIEARSRDVDGAYVCVSVHDTNTQGVKVSFQTDKFGFRTMYYVRTADEFLFASHIAGIRELLEGRLPRVDATSLLHYYHFGITSNRRTLLSGVQKVPAGTIMTVSLDGSAAERTYFDPLDLYDPDGVASTGSFEDSCHRVDGALATSVGRRLGAQDRVALAISGGVDSGFIAKKLVQAQVSVAAYNLAYGTEYDESQRLDQLAADLGLNVVRIRLQPLEVWQAFESASTVASEPIAFNDAVLTYLARRARAEGASTVWDGDGADRLFLGMRGHLKYARAGRLFDGLQRMGVTRAAIAGLAVTPHPEARKLAAVWRNWANGIPPYPERQYGAVQRYDMEREERIFQMSVSSFWQQFQRRVPNTDVALFLSYVAIRMCPERFFHAPVEQQYGFDTRPVSPYWDDDVVSLGLSLPTAMKIKGRQTKYVLRRAAALNSSPDYWMLSKIGLQNAFTFWTRSAPGTEWLAETRARILGSEELNLLREAGEVEPDPDRLARYWSWRCAHEVRA